MEENSIGKFIWVRNVERLNSWNKVVFFIHLGLLLTSDVYNYFNQVWEVFPSQYYVFINHIASLPILGFFVYYNASVLKKGNATSIPRLKWLLAINILSFLPMLLIYYYWDLVDYSSSGIMMIYICAVGFLFRFPQKQVIYMTLFLSTVYFGMLFFVQTTYDLNPSLYLNGVAILVIYFFFSRILYQSEYEIFESKFKIEEKNLILELLNKNLSKSEKKIRQQNIILKEQNKSLDNFAQIVAHDVKAPLKMIQSFSEEVSVKYKNSLEEIDRPLFDYICKGSENLIGIVDGLYDFTQISTKGELKFTKVNFDHTINKTVLLLSKELNANKVQVIIAPGFPVVYGVEELLQNVLLNLFCNAIKFRRQDIDSVVELKHNTGEEGFVEICIRDNGIGIPKDSFEKVFQLFKKLHPSTEYEGFGIGLTTCKKIIEKHDGEIWINSEENQGTSVFFTLLLANIQNIKNRDKILNTALEF